MSAAISYPDVPDVISRGLFFFFPSDAIHKIQALSLRYKQKNGCVFVGVLSAWGVGDGGWESDYSVFRFVTHILCICIVPAL